MVTVVIGLERPMGGGNRAPCRRAGQTSVRQRVRRRYLNSQLDHDLRIGEFSRKRRRLAASVPRPAGLARQAGQAAMLGVVESIVERSVPGPVRQPSPTPSATVSDTVMRRARVRAGGLCPQAQAHQMAAARACWYWSMRRAEGALIWVKRKRGVEQAISADDSRLRGQEAAPGLA